MSATWIADVDGDLVNLEMMENIKVLHLVETENDDDFAVIARAPSIGAAGEEYWLFEGKEGPSKDYLNELKERLLK